MPRLIAYDGRSVTPTRTVRDHAHNALALRPRRVRCRTCRVTHVLLPAVVTPRRADATAVIESALLASARGTGDRRIAARGLLQRVDRRAKRGAGRHRRRLAP
jgi:hypothetical protein